MLHWRRGPHLQEPHGDKSQDPLEQPASNVAGVKSTDQMAVATANRHIEPPANSGALMSSHRLFCPPQFNLVWEDVG